MRTPIIIFSGQYYYQDHTLVDFLFLMSLDDFYSFNVIWSCDYVIEYINLEVMTFHVPWAWLTYLCYKFKMHGGRPNVNNEDSLI